MTAAAGNWLRSEVRSAALILALTCLVFAALTGGFVAFAMDTEHRWPATIMFGPVALGFVWGLARSAWWAYEPYSHPDFRPVAARGPLSVMVNRIAADAAAGERVGHLRLGREWYVYRRPLGLQIALGHFDDIRAVEREYVPRMGPIVRLKRKSGKPQVLPARTTSERDAMADAMERRLQARNGAQAKPDAAVATAHLPKNLS